MFNITDPIARVVNAAIDLSDFLGHNVGDNADWPVKILIDNDGAPLIPKLNELKNSIKALRKKYVAVKPARLRK